MKKARYLRIYDLHSWSGIILGLFVYVVSFTGCIALFDHELKSWEDPAKRLSIPQEPIIMMSTFEAWVNTTAQEDTVRTILFSYPDYHRPYYQGFMTTVAEGSKPVNHRVKWSAETGDVLIVKEPALTEWLLDFHRDLMWPASIGGRTAGRTIVGIAGIILLLSIITGIITHTKIIKEFFTLRVKRSIHLKWQDMHKVIGLWTLPFSTMIAFTGAILGVVVILAPLAALLAFKGDTQSVIEAVVGKPAEPAGIYAPMYSVDELITFKPDQRPSFVSITNWGDENAEYRLSYKARTELNRFNRFFLKGSSGELIRSESVSTLRPDQRVNNAITPLHYGTYGGVWLKIVYLIMGIFLCVVTATGLMVWIERRLKSKKGKKKPEFYYRLGRLTIGTTLGFPVATIALFYLDKFYIGSEDNRLFYTGITYFSVVAFVIFFSMLRKKDYLTVRYLFLLSAIGCLFLPLVNWLTTKGNFIANLSRDHSWAWVDFGFMSMSFALFIVAYCLPKQRGDEPRVTNRDARIVKNTPKIRTA